MPTVATGEDSASSDLEELLFQQTAAIVDWLKFHNLEQSAATFADVVRTELNETYSTNRHLPKQIAGEWKWMPVKADQESKAGSRGNDDSSDSDSEGSSLDSDEQESSESSSDFETDSSEYETDSGDENESDQEEKSDMTSLAHSREVVASPPSTRRCVSFEECAPGEFLYSPIRKNEKAMAFWSKKELLEIKNAEAMERMAAIMSESVFRVPGIGP